MITVGSLFSGIGGLELGLERTGGFKAIWQCEIEPYCCEVLKKHWPEVPNIGDITKVDWNGIERPDMLCGGFPCQDISIAGKGKGIKEGTRSGLWFEFAKAIRILRPKYALIENVPMLANRGLNIVLADLAEAGYDAEWFTLSAAEVGANHKRERLFVFAYSSNERCNIGSDNEREHKDNPERKSTEDIEGIRRLRSDASTICEDVSHSQKLLLERFANRPWERELRRSNWWEIEPDVGRVVDELPKGLDSYIWRKRIESLGNAVVPQVAQQIGEWILEWEKEPKHLVVKPDGFTSCPEPSGSVHSEKE